MCNRYQPGERKRIVDFFDARVLQDVNAGPAIVHPREPGWVMRAGEDGAGLVLEQMTWGFPVYVNGRTGKRGQPLKPKPVNNARFDKLGSFWRRWASIPAQRCLIPAVRYAEAVGEPGRMTTTWLSLRSQPVFAWAGLWTNSDEWGPAYSAVMTSCATELAEIHDRSPVILARSTGRFGSRRLQMNCGSSTGLGLRVTFALRRPMYCGRSGDNRSCCRPNERDERGN